MAGTILAVTLVTLKLANGDVLLTFQSPSGTEKFVIALPSADVTSLNTTTNGGSTGATQTFTYGQDANKADYPTSYYQKET
jgi:hypothetical protein